MGTVCQSRPNANCAARSKSCAFVQALCLVGEFNNWQAENNHWAMKNDFGVWQLFLPDKEDGTPAIPHRSHTFSHTWLALHSGSMR